MSSLRQRVWPLRLRERGSYLVMRLSLAVGYGVTRVMVGLAPLLRRAPDRDLAIYMFNPLDSDGHYRRFKVFFPDFERDGVDYELFSVFGEHYAKTTLDGPAGPRYLMFAKLYWTRLFQVLRARRFRQVLIQRNLFPYYPDKRFPHLERLARSLCDDISVDFWDPVYLWDPEVTYASLEYADRLICDNSRLLRHFEGRFPSEDSYTWPIAVDTAKYTIKTDYSIHDPVRLFYTGSYVNVRANLEPLVPILERLHAEVPLELTVIGVRSPESDVLTIRHLPWSEDTYYSTLAESDIALFPFFIDNDEHNSERVAGKTLDYMATGLPFIGAPAGLAEGADPQRHLVAVASNEPQEWIDQLRSLIDDQPRREKVGNASRLFIEAYCPVDRMYHRLRAVLAAPGRNSGHR